MDWTEILMSALIASIISSAVVLLSVVITDLLSSKRVESKLEKHDDRLISTEQKLKDSDNQLESQLYEKNAMLSKEHLGLSHDHERIIDRLADVRELASKTYISFVKSEESRNNRYENLNDTQREIHKSIGDVERLLTDWEHVITENKSLTQRNVHLTEDVDRLSEKLTILTEQNKELRNHIAQMEQNQYRYEYQVFDPEI